MLLELRLLHVDPDAVGGEKIGRSPTERFRALHAITDASHQGGRASAGHASGVAGAAGPRHSPRAGRLWRRWQPAARRARHRDARQLLQARRHPGAGRHPGALLQRGPRRPQRGRRQRRLVDAAEHPVGRRRHGHALQAGGVPLLLHLPRHQRRPGHGRHHRGRRRPLRDQREHHRQGPAGGPPGQRRHPARAPGLPDHPGGAVNAASPGDLVLVGPGVYREEVKVTIPSLVIRGTDRNQVVVDGEFRRPNAISVTADGVAVENLTVRNAVANGLFWTGVTGYRASYVTASANGDYGIYAFGSRDGVFEQSYASGSPDAGFYIGQCNPCDAVIDGVVSEGNALGYSGTNASDLDIPNHGILVTPNLDEHFWTSAGNQVRDNVIAGSGRADLALAGPAGAGNCFSGNTVRSTVPVGLQAFQSCGGLRLPMRMDLSTTLQSLGLVAEANLDAFPHHRSQDAPPAPPQPQMAGGTTAPVRPAVDIYDDHRVDLDQIALPAPPADQRATVRKEPTVFGVPILASSAWQVIFGLSGYLLPFALFAAWVSLALWDLARRDDLGRGATIAWVGVVLVVPFLGVIAYHALGRPRIPGWLRATMIGGGIVAYVLILAIGALIGGIV